MVRKGERVTKRKVGGNRKKVGRKGVRIIFKTEVHLLKRFKNSAVS